MPNFKDILPNIFNNNNSSKSKSNNSNSEQKSDPKHNKNVGQEGRLETDALPVDDFEEAGNRRIDSSSQPENASSTSLTVSAELTESAVRELSNPNYDSGLGTVVQGMSSLDLAAHPGSSAPTAAMNNTMNVHNAQQQVVMQFSNAQNLHFGSVYNINSNLSASACQKGAEGGCSDEKLMLMNGDGGKRQSSQQPRKTTSIVAMMQSKEHPNHRMLDTIATHLGEGWKSIMRELGQSDGQIDQALIDHQMHGGIKEVIYQLLLQWVRNADDAYATLGYITTLLWELNQRDCVQRMKLVWKAEARRKTSR